MDMSANKPKVPVFDPGLCRCCGTLKKCRLLNAEYYCLGQKEIYSDMFVDCFGLLLSHLDTKPTERLVCASCVVRLRDACNFKQQVLRCEEAFLQMKVYDGYDDSLGNNEDLRRPRVDVQGLKTEPVDRLSDYTSPDHLLTQSDHDDSDHLKQEVANDDSSSNDDIPILQRLTRRKTQAFPIKRLNSARSKPGVSGVKVARGGKPRSAANVTAKNCLAVNNQETMSKLQEQNRERDVTYLTETNILNIVEFSHVCPFKCRHNNLMCYYCGHLCPEPDELRLHTATEHSPKKFKISEHKKMVKVDITRIDCRLCDEKIDSLDVFKKHLAVHNKKYYFSASDTILPFRLTRNELCCVLCDQKYPYFHALNKHMNVHFRNYICDTCGLGFVDKCRFVMHQQRHEVGEFPCGTCGRLFTAQYNRDLHIDRVHNKKGRVYCPKCDVKLMSYPQKLKHLVEVHGEDPLSFPCNLCEKIYMTRRMLTIHKRKDHLKDYRYECQYCGQKFFTRFALNNHMPTHTGERNFKCKVCEKSYPRLKTLKDHMRIHTNDRRYRCHICGQAFIQNCSLKGHLKSQHPEYG